MPDPAPPIRILLIDDDPDAALTVDWQLRKGWRPELFGGSGFALRQVLDADAANAALVGGEFDLCLLDQRLGAMTGTHVLQIYRAWGGARPVVLFTQFDDSRTFDLAWPLRVAEVVCKDGLSPQRLVQILARVHRDALELAAMQARLAEAERRLRELADDRRPPAQAGA